MRLDDLQPLDLPPGIVRNATQYQVKGRWYDGNLIRWVDGRMRPVGGWQRVTTTPIAGAARDMLSWSDNSGDRWIAVGTTSGLFVSHGDNVVYNITPAAFVSGPEDALETLGYGGGLYNAGTYGTVREGGTYFPPATWSLDNWGHFLVGCSTSDGRIVQWQLNTAVPAAVVSGAPTDCTSVIVSDERHVIALGYGGNLRGVKWCDKEDINLWTPADTNEAGDFDLHTQSAIKAAVRVRGQILILTQTDAHAMRYIGQPFIYSRERVGSGCGLVSAGALVSAESQAFWMSDGAFWYFDGATAQVLNSDVSDYVFGDINRIQIEKVAGGHNERFGEIWWSYPSNASDEPDRYVFFNYRGGFWGIGQLPRTCWDAGAVLGNPHAIGVDGHLYRHEADWTDNGSARFSSIYATSGVLELGSGGRIMHIGQILPDEETEGEVTLTFRSRFTPGGNEYTFGPYVARDDGYLDARVSGRQITLKVQPIADGSFSIGRYRGEVTAGGKR